MESSDSLKLDENLVRFLAAYDQSIEGGDGGAATVNVPLPGAPAGACVDAPHSGSGVNGGSLGNLLPDSGRMHAPGVAGPHRIGRFELRRQLGKGGCGIVFLAYDPKLQREVALKIPRPEMVLNPDSRSRLKREALAAAEFDHPNLVPVFEYGDIGPLCYVATAFCSGQTLADWLDRQAFPVPVRQGARLVATVAEAVQHAHDRGVVHRDLKPNNVILQEMKLEENDEAPGGSVPLRGDYYVPRLVDFGLAKLAERGGPSETGTRQVLGTPKYMAPEQAQARREDIGPPADVYALGVILYEMLAGRAPYDGASDVEVLRQAVEGKPVAPRSLRPDIPRDLEAICLKAMARGTANRYRTAIDLADDLRRFLDGRPTVARPLAWPARAGRWFRRNDQLVAIAVLAFTVLFVTALAGRNWFDSRKLREEHNSALTERANRDRAQQERDYSRQMRDAFLAWRGGNDRIALESLASARGTAAALGEPPDFTHDYLRRLLKSPRLVVVCPAGPVTALAVSPDGARLASGHADGTLAMWDRATGRRLGTASAHASGVAHAAFALGGTRLFTAGLRGGKPEAACWAVSPSGELAPAPEAHPALGEGVTCLAVAPDGRTLFAGTRAGKLRRLSLAAPDRSGACDCSAVSVVGITASRDGKAIFTADGGGRVRRWSPDLKPFADFGDVRARVTALAALDEARAAVGCLDGRTLVLPERAPGAEFDAGVRVRWLASAGGAVAQNGAAGRAVLDRLTELPTGDIGDVLAGAFSPDARALFTGSRDGVIRTWNLPRDRRDRGALRVGPVAALGVSGDGATFGVAADGRVLIFAGSASGRPLPGLPRRCAAVRILDGAKVRAVALDGPTAILRDFSAGSWSERARLPVPGGRTATAAALLHDGSRLAVGDDSGRVALWLIGEAKPRASIDTGSGRPVPRVLLSADGRYLAAPVLGGVGVWGAETGERVGTGEGDDEAAFALLPQDRLAVAGRDGVVRVRSFAGRDELALLGHVGRVTGLGASPDGRTLVSGGATGEVKFWDVRTGVELLGVRRHSTPVTAAEFAAGGKLLVTAGDGQLAVWDARE